MPINLHWGEERWQRIAHDWTAWWAGDLARPMVVVQTIFADEQRAYAPHFASNLPFDMPVDALLDRYQRLLETMHFWGDAWPRWFPNFGPGILAESLGAQAHAAPDTVWFTPPPAASSIERIELERDAHSPWFARLSAITRRAVERWGGDVTIGHTDMGGNLDILASLRTTEQLLLDVSDSPAHVERLVGQITQVWMQAYDDLYATVLPTGRGTCPWAAIWSPGRCYMLQCDFSYMISPAMFERFVLPDLSACCDHLDHAFYHMDGRGQIRHLDMLLSLPRLHGIQWVPGDGSPPPEEWLPLLKRIRDAGKLCQLNLTASGALAIARALGGRGFAFNIKEAMPEEDVAPFLEEMSRY